MADESVQVGETAVAVAATAEQQQQQQQEEQPAAVTPVVKEESPTKAIEKPQEPAKEPPAKSKPCMEGLSEEIKALIVEWVLRPSDLQNVCLVNKQFHSIAVRFLYRHVSFDLGSANDHRLSSFLNPGNIGLKYMRRLRLYLAPMLNGDNCAYRDHQVNFATRMILEFMPADVLEEFNWCPWKPFGTDNLLLLYRRQRNLKVLEAMRLDRDVLADLKKNTDLDKGVFKSARELGLYPEDRTTLNMGGFLVEKTRENLEELIINWGVPSSSSANDGLSARDLNDSPTGPGALTSSIFSSMVPFDKCTPLPRLNSLRLYNVSVRQCADTWCKVVDFQNLEYLRLGNCGGADALIGQLSKSAHLPKKLKTLGFENRTNSDEALVALDGFLCLVSGIKDLFVELIGVSSLPAAAGIVRHAKTLTQLSVHCSPATTAGAATDGDRSALVYDVSDFERICKACTKLEQLSCAWPSLSLIRNPNDKWKAYESATHQLQDLVTLHVATYPSNKPSKRALQRSIYEKLVQAQAQRMFDLAAKWSPEPDATPATSTENNNNAAANADNAAANANTTDGAAPATTTTIAPGTDPSPAAQPRRLRLIAFGAAENIYERKDSEDQFLYIRSSRLDAEGRTQVAAAPLGWCLRQFIEPRSNVLEYRLDRSILGERLPFREDSAGNDSDDDD